MGKRSFLPLKLNVIIGRIQLLLQWLLKRQLESFWSCTLKCWEQLHRALLLGKVWKTSAHFFNYCEIKCLARITILKIYNLFMVQTERQF